MPNPDFYKKASTALFSTLDIASAWQECRLVMRGYLPVDYLSLHLFDENLQIVETVVDAGPDGSKLTSVKSTLTPEACAALKEAMAGGMTPKPELTMVDCLGEHEISRQLGLDLKTPEASCMAMDLIMDGDYLGFAVATNLKGRLFTKSEGKLFLSLHGPLAITAAHFHRYRQLDRVRRILKDRAEFLGRELMRADEGEIVGANFGLKTVMKQVEQVAPTDSPVLITGETGVGKEIVARSLHRLSRRAEKPFIKVNCGAIAPNLLESELFGHEKGAFTGAHTSRKGYFELAHGGTIFLDEIGELPLEAQVRFLRVLQDKEVMPIGGQEARKLDIRIIAATNRDLEAMMARGGYRQDLYFRLSVFPVMVPPLRRRKEDIPALTYYFLDRKCRKMALPDIPNISRLALRRLMDYDWPGNVRELENIVERQVIINPGGPLEFDGLEPMGPYAPDQIPANGEMGLDEVVSAHIRRVLKQTGGRVEGRNGAAQLLKMNPRTLQSRMRKLGIPFGRKAKRLYGGS